MMRRTEADSRAEIDAHIALETDRLVAEGASPADARAAALRRFGNVTQARERFYQSRRVMWLDALRQDLQYALRTYARAPLFTMTAVASLAIGIGADTAIFTVANSLLFRAPFGVVEPDRLVDISNNRDGFGINQISFLDYLDIRERVTTVEGMYGYDPLPQPVSLAGAMRTGAERVFGHKVTPKYFSVLGVGPAIGRVFDGNDREGVDGGALVLSHGFWTRRFNQDPDVVGEVLLINGQPLTVIGVAAEGFRGTGLITTDVWVPLAVTPFEGSFLLRRELGWALLRGRLKPGVSVASAAAELETIGRTLEREYPEYKHGRGLRLAAASQVPGNLALPLAGVLSLVIGFVSLILVIACANLAGVLLARASARRREIAVRVAVGAGRARVVRQLLTETAVLVVLGGGAGVLVASGLTSLIVAVLPALPVPVDLSLALDSRVLAFTTGLSLIAAVLCGLAPALDASKVDVVSILKNDPPGLSGLRRRNAFVAVQVALSVVLVVAAGLFMRALQQATSSDPGFDPHGVELAELDLSLAGYTPATGPPFAAELVERIRALPGVQHASMAAVLPNAGRTRFGDLSLPGSTLSNLFVEADWNAVEASYFATLRIALVAGRDFSAADRAGAQPVVIVSEEAARRFWPSENPLGKALLQHPPEIVRGQAHTPKMLVVIGVVRDLKARAGALLRVQIYLPLQQQYVPRTTIVVRTVTGQRVAGEIRSVVASMDPNLPVLLSQTFEEAAKLALLPQRVAAAVSASLGAVGLLLAAIGVYGVTAYAVTHRTREIGIRMALGAERAGIIGMILRQSMGLVACGSAIGLILAGAAGWVLPRVWLGFPRIDGVTLGGAVALFAAIALAACYLPVRRAASVDPVNALRCD